MFTTVSEFENLKNSTLIKQPVYVCHGWFSFEWQGGDMYPQKCLTKNWLCIKTCKILFCHFVLKFITTF